MTNSSQGPARYWIAQGGSAAGELTLYSPVAATSQTPQPTAAVPTAAVQSPPQQPTTAGQVPSSGAGAQQSPPPLTLPVTGGAPLILSFGAVLALVAVGRLLRL
jgi:hypothetical protein